MLIIPNKVIALGSIECNDCESSIHEVGDVYHRQAWEDHKVHDIYYVHGHGVYSCPCHQDYQYITKYSNDHIKHIWKLEEPADTSVPEGAPY
jgi:hypothetical protein